ncbi:hypothetical protein EVAR_95812_1 [Eumeta japonica]|uniref:Uncharacterized protein n=1 Tax=Eumeta variegata TaxID=151549 RepID=A0A4C1W2S5_EUMVA|nr:hypothetical protein EVAR_95812_1 [Eumeta japonica]
MLSHYEDDAVSRTVEHHPWDPPNLEVESEIQRLGFKMLQYLNRVCCQDTGRCCPLSWVSLKTSKGDRKNFALEVRVNGKA